MSDELLNDLDRATRAERNLLAACLWSDAHSGDGFDRAGETITPTDFAVFAHRVVWIAMGELREESKPVTAATVYEQLRAKGEVNELGEQPGAWLASLLELAPNDAYAEYFAGLVKEAARMRGLRHVAAEITAAVTHAGTRPAADVIADCEEKLFAAGDDDTASGPVQASELAAEALTLIDERARRDGPDGILTGFRALDGFLSGLKAGQLVVVGARPGCGKTALALAIAAHASAAGERVLFASLEMSKGEMMDRLLSMRSDVPMGLIQTGRLKETESSRVYAAAMKFHGEPFEMDDSADLTAARLAAMVRRAVRRRGVKLVIVDYLQLMRPENERDPRHLQVGTLSRRLKQLARSCKVPVIVLAQLNRQVEGRQDGKPKLSDLRESGEIEANANTVILIHPQPDQRHDSPVWLTDLIIAKNRGGPIGEVTVDYHRARTRFADSVVGAN